jgi:hypothetical protein
MSGGVKKLASVVIGAVVGFAQGGPWGAVAGAALAFYAAEQQEKLNTKSPLRDNEPSAQTVRSSKAPVRFILGRVSTGGVLVWAQEQSGAQGEGEWLHLVYVLSEGPIDALENIYLGEEEIGAFGPLASYELIVNPTQVNAFLKANCPDWKDSQIGRGLSFVRVSLQYSAEKFPSGIPDTRFVVRGRNDIYDPRTGTAVYSANTALHLLWFLRARCGVPDDEIVFETFASASNVCDEALTNADGSTSQRYRSGCVIGADEQRTGVLQKLEAASGGHLIRVGGRWMFQAGAYYGPYDFEITEDMVIGTVTGSTEPTNDSAINTVRGTFIDPDQSWTETDYPEVSVAEWIVEDGGEAAETLTYSYVTDPYQAQRLANMELRRRRAGGAISIPMNFSGYNCRPGRVVRVNLPSLNILGEFIVSDWSMGDSEGCTVQVKQYEAAIFDDAVGQPYNPLGFINLPTGGLGSPTSLVWAAGDEAEVIQGVLSWAPPSGIISEYVVIVRQGATAVQSHNVPATSTKCLINGLPSGSYTMSVAALGPMARSGEATITVGIGGPPIPESCVVQSSIDNIVLIPQNPNYGLNGGTYEYFFSTSPTATADDADFLGRGLSFTHTGLAFYTNYYYFVRSSNAYGKSAFLRVPTSTSNDVSAYLASLAGKISETELGQNLLGRIELIDGPSTLLGSVNYRLKELDDQVTEVTDQLQEQINQVSDIANSAEYQKDKAYEAGSSTRLNDRLYQAKIAVPADLTGANAPPNTTYWLDVGQVVTDSNGLAARVSTTETKITSIEGVNTAQGTAITGLQSSLNGKADASALNSLTTRVSSAEGTISSQGTAITGLNNSLTTTNTNVTAAQTAANAANTLAGGKGKVLVQTAAPAAADQLAQNLWIDITGGANTPKRWTGSAWLAVSDKVATDAAAAAATALSQVATKAEAATVTALSNTVTQQGDTLTAQGQSLTSIQTSIGGLGAAGTNLLVDKYSWLTSVTLPATVSGSSLARAGISVAEASSGFGIKLTTASTSTSQFLMLSPTNNIAGWNIDLEPGSYLVSMYVKASAVGAMRISMYNGTHRYSANATYGTTRQRMVFVCTATAFARAAITIYPNMSALAAGTEITIDSIMIEKMAGANTSSTPSPFVAGNSAVSVSGQAVVTSALDARVTQTEGVITAQASAFQALRASSRDDNGEGELADALKGWTSTAAIASESKVRTSENEAMAQRITTFDVAIGENAANITELEQVVVTNESATATKIDQLSVTVGQNGSDIQQNSAAIQQTATAYADTNGKLSTMWSVKMQVTAGGQYVAAGIGLGIENTGAGLQSQFLVSADRFAIVNTIAGGTVSVPFAVVGGQVFMNSAYIQDGTITNAKIGSYISSTNYVAGQQGWILNKDGTLEINGIVPGQGRLVINALNVSVYDANNVLRVRLGYLG